MGAIIAATEKTVAVIELTDEEKERLPKINPDFLTGGDNFPQGVRLTISQDEALSSEVPDSVRGDLLEIP